MVSIIYIRDETQRTQRKSLEERELAHCSGETIYAHATKRLTPESQTDRLEPINTAGSNQPTRRACPPRLVSRSATY
jgi:hypothetical protein